MESFVVEIDGKEYIPADKVAGMVQDAVHAGRFNRFTSASMLTEQVLQGSVDTGIRK